MKYLFLALLYFFTANAMAAELKTTADAKSLATDIMNFMAKGEVKNGLQLAKPHMNLSDENFAKIVQSFEKQQPALVKKFGKTLAVEFINEVVAGQSFMKIIFAQKFEKHAKRWIFYFYKPEEIWSLNTFTTDDKIQKLFE